MARTPPGGAHICNTRKIPSFASQTPSLIITFFFLNRHFLDRVEKQLLNWFTDDDLISYFMVFVTWVTAYPLLEKRFQAPIQFAASQFDFFSCLTLCLNMDCIHVISHLLCPNCYEWDVFTQSTWCTEKCRD